MWNIPSVSLSASLLLILKIYYIQKGYIWKALMGMRWMPVATHGLCIALDSRHQSDQDVMVHPEYFNFPCKNLPYWYEQPRRKFEMWVLWVIILLIQYICSSASLVNMWDGCDICPSLSIPQPHLLTSFPAVTPKYQPSSPHQCPKLSVPYLK